MKNIIWAIVVLIVAAGFIMESRYALVIDSPVVAKVDRFTGDVWIVNSGVWRKVLLSPSENVQQEKQGDIKPAAE